MKECGLTECELWAPQIEPAQPPPAADDSPEEQRRNRARSYARWRVETPLITSKAIRKKFDAAGISDLRLQLQLRTRSFTDEEIDRGFEMAKALGAEIITASTTLTSPSGSRRSPRSTR